MSRPRECRMPLISTDPSVYILNRSFTFNVFVLMAFAISADVIISSALTREVLIVPPLINVIPRSA